MSVAMPRSQAEWKRAVRGFDEHLAVRRITATWREMRWMSTERFLRHAGTVARWMRQDGLSDVEVIRLPADGRTAHGGWVLPLAWSPRSARLELLSPAGKPRLLADYRACPHHLGMWSASTPRGGVTAELVANGAPPRGRIIMLDGAPDVEHIVELQRAGALGFVTDYVRLYKGIREAADVDDAVSYLNYTQPQWQVPARDRGFGFAVSPAEGRRLRALLAQGPVRLHAEVDVELGEGELPVITGRLPGRTGQEIIITGHIDEPGANDNASGPMLSLGIARTLAALVRRGWRPERGLRFFFSIEARAINALLNMRPQLFANGVWGLNLDMHGCDHRKVRSKLDFCPNAPPLPDPLQPLLERTLLKMHGRPWKAGPMVDDNNMGDPAVGIPTTVLVQGPDLTYHTSMDTPEHLSPPAVRRMGLWASALLGRLCSAGPREIAALARLSHGWSVERLAAIDRDMPEAQRTEHAAVMRHHVAQERKRLEAWQDWIADPPFPWTGVAVPRLGRGHLSGPEAARQEIAALSRELAGRAPPAPPPAEPADRFAREAARLVPLKTYRGFFANESLTRAQRLRLEEIAGGRFWWSAPAWLDWALWWSTGKQTLAEIADLLRHERRPVPMERLVRTFRCLEELGFVRFRPRLDERDIRRAVRQAGVKPGMLLMVHSSLSAFGYVAGGSQACIGALRAALGPSGTLAMPTHSSNALGKAVFDPATSPSAVGAVTEAFRRMPGVLRSAHPTHSVAAQGPLAEALTAGHGIGMAPLAREGFWGRFVDRDGWVLMMAPQRSNTLMHAAELWSGVPLPGYQVPEVVGGRWRAREVPGGPWHVHWFSRLYAALRESGRLRTVPLGEGEIHLMRGRDVVEAGLALFRDDPLLVCKPGCPCPFCCAVRAAVPIPAATGRGAGTGRRRGARAKAGRRS
jgi:aminoglycoside 3-N-acetyltransferase